MPSLGKAVVAIASEWQAVLPKAKPRLIDPSSILPLNGHNGRPEVAQHNDEVGVASQRLKGGTQWSQQAGEAAGLVPRQIALGAAPAVDAASADSSQPSAVRYSTDSYSDASGTTQSAPIIEGDQVGSMLQLRRGIRQPAGFTGQSQPRIAAGETDGDATVDGSLAHVCNVMRSYRAAAGAAGQVHDKDGRDTKQVAHAVMEVLGRGPGAVARKSAGDLAPATE